MKKLLGVNVDHVATLRQARGTSYPDAVEAGLMAEAAGADSITVHLRGDRRHIQPSDVFGLKEKLKIPLNLEMAATEEMLQLALEVKPTYCCLVPERREELTTEGGLDVVKHHAHLDNIVHALTQAKILVSLFIESDFKQIEAAKTVRAPLIELHTGEYADAKTPEAIDAQLRRLHAAAKYAAEQGLQVNAGHGLQYQNTPAIVAIPEIHELNIGHAIISRAVFVGIEAAVKEMLALIRHT